MFSKKFYSALEYKISQTFANEKDKDLSCLWCDGVYIPDNEVNFNKEYIKAKSKIELKAWFGKTGQEVHKLILNLGKESKESILEGEDLIRLIPSVDDDWIYYDSINKVIEVKLD